MREEEKKVKAVLVALFMVMSISMIGWKSSIYAALTAEKAGDSSEVIQITSENRANPKYAFHIKANANTKVEPFTANPNNSGIELENNFWAFNAPDDSWAGNFGAWVRDVGTYHGAVVDIKCTFSWNTKVVNGYNCIPLITLKVNDTNGIEIGYATRNIKVTYELYSNGQPIRVNMAMNFQDVDGHQYFGFHPSTGTVSQVQCTSDCTLLYAHNSDNEWYYMDSDAGLTSPSNQTAMRFEVDNTNRFIIMYGVPFDATYHQEYRSYAYLHGECSDEKVYNSAVKKDEWWKNAQKGIQLDGLTDIATKPAVAYFTSQALGAPMDTPNPVKTVTDRDETEVTESTLSSYKEAVTYNISQMVPDNGSGYYKAFAIIDMLPEGFEYKEANIWIGGQDISNWFDIYKKGNVVTAAAKTSVLTNFRFYGREYVLKISGTQICNTTTTASTVTFYNQAVTKTTTSAGDYENHSNSVISKYSWKYFDFNVSKVWEDAQNCDGLRPESVIVVLKRDIYTTDNSVPVDTQELGAVVLSEKNHWSSSIKNVKDLSDGQSEKYTYKYTWEEKSVDGYTTIYDVNGYDTIITNVHKPEPEPTEPETTEEESTEPEPTEPETTEEEPTEPETTEEKSTESETTEEKTMTQESTKNMESERAENVPDKTLTSPKTGDKGVVCNLFVFIMAIIAMFIALHVERKLKIMKE